MIHPEYTRFPVVTTYKITGSYTFGSVTISCRDNQDFYSQINSLQKEITDIRLCTPLRTDTHQWYKVIYKEII